MSGIILCTKQAKDPLYVEGGTIGIYNLEELCYYLYNYTYMITIDFFDENFLYFCDKQIGQPALVQKIKEGLAHREKLKTLIIRVLETSSYYSEDEIKRFEASLAYLDSSSVSERFKVRADMMAKAGRLKAALSVYKDILKSKEEVMSLQFYSRVRSNIGVVYTKMFMYDEAASYFEQAYEAEPVEEYRDYLICALLMSENEERLSSVSEKYGWEYSLINEYRIAFDNVNRIVCTDERFNAFMEQFRYKGTKDLSSHYEKITETIANWKEDYRKSVEC